MKTFSSYFIWTKSFFPIVEMYTGLNKEETKRLGKALNIDLSSTSDFWKTFYIKIYDKQIRLDISNPMQELEYLFLKNHKHSRHINIIKI